MNGTKRKLIDRPRYLLLVSGTILLSVFSIWLVSRGVRPLKVDSGNSINELLRPVPPQSPQEAVKTFKTLDGFRMELVAHEPLVYDPVSAAFDEDGYLYVTEMRDYPFSPREREPPSGRVRVLEDTDGDGKFDQSYVFAEHLRWPAGVVPWEQGVFVAAPPDIWYLKDTDGDHRADVRLKILTGFGTQNEQGGVNNLIWGLDHMIYGSASINGGEVHRMDGSDAEPVSLKGSDFRFDPRTGEFEAIGGGGQFGNTFDDWGNRFLCTQSRPTFHVLLPRWYLKRNPYLAVAKEVLNLVPQDTPIFRASGLEGWRQIRSNRRIAAHERPDDSSGVSQHVLDAVAGVTVYRGDAYPEKYRGNLFVGEAQHNLIHRRLLIPDGVTFKSVRADQNVEFVTSTDNWFRPVNFVHAPDGTLLVLDMSREIIESIHLPHDVAKRIDLTSGQNYGRIYRLRPPAFQVRSRPRLSQASNEALVQHLEHPNGWWRDTAQRLLYERQAKQTIPVIRRLLQRSQFPQGRLHALWALHGLGGLEDSDLLLALQDAAAGVREHAARLSEPRLNNSTELLNKVLQLAEDPADRVRLQVAFTLGTIENHRAVAGLTRIVLRDGANAWIRTAVLSSSAEITDRLAVGILNRGGEREDVRLLLEQVSFIVGSRNKRPEVDRLLNATAADRIRQSDASFAVVLGLGKGLRKAGVHLTQLKSHSPSAAALIEDVLRRAMDLARRESADLSRRRQAVELLGHGEHTLGLLADMLAPRQPKALQLAAVESLQNFDHLEVARILLKGWKGYSPDIRAKVADTLLSREEWTGALLDKVVTGEVDVNQIGQTHRTALVNHPEPSIRARAKKWLGVEESSRQDVVKRYRAALALRGDPAAGEKVYDDQCMACHRMGGKGYAVGPNLATLDMDAEALLVNILDPNRRQQPEYVLYIVIDNDGRMLTGFIAAETATSIMLKGERNIQQTILRRNIQTIRSTTKSMMPEGLEESIDLQQMADLLAFLKSVRYDIGTLPGRKATE